MHHQTVKHNINIVLLILVKLYLLAQIVHVAVNADAHIAAAPSRVKHLFMHTFSRADNRRQHHKTSSVRDRHYLLEYSFERLLAYLLAAYRAVRDTYPRV